MENTRLLHKKTNKLCGHGNPFVPSIWATNLLTPSPLTSSMITICKTCRQMQSQSSVCLPITVRDLSYSSLLTLLLLSIVQHLVPVRLLQSFGNSLHHCLFSLIWIDKQTDAASDCHYHLLPAAKWVRSK